MITISSDVLQSWVLGLLLPLTRIMAMISLMPIIGHHSTPNRVKIALGVFITLIVMPTLPAIPHIDVISWQGLLIVANQIMIGLAIGFMMRMVFAAIDLAGQLIGSTMGLGFATFFDPQSKGQTNVVNQLLVLLASLIFLSINGHLMLITALVDSFTTMPITGDVKTGINPYAIAVWGENIFSAGLLMSLPAVTALLITNMALGILSRTAPQLNLFGIGLPITLTMGIIIIALTLPGMLQPMQRIIESGISASATIGGNPIAGPAIKR